MQKREDSEDDGYVNQNQEQPDVIATADKFVQLVKDSVEKLQFQSPQALPKYQAYTPHDDEQPEPQQIEIKSVQNVNHKPAKQQIVNQPTGQPQPQPQIVNQSTGQQPTGQQSTGQQPTGQQTGQQTTGQKSAGQPARLFQQAWQMQNNGDQNSFGRQYGSFVQQKNTGVQNPLLTSMYTQKNIEDTVYKVGDFVQFAQKIESKVNVKENIIRKIVSEAVYSYEKRIKQNQKKIQQLLNFEGNNKDLLSQFGSQEKMREYMNDELGFVYRETQKDISNFSITQIIKKQYNRKKTLISSAQVDGKFLSIKKLRLKQRFYHDRFLYLPTSVQGIYVRLDNTGKLYKVRFEKGTFFDQKMLQQLSQNMKQQIIGMVLLYLKTEQIIVQKSSTQDLYNLVSSFFEDIKRKQLIQAKKVIDQAMKP